jgi:tetratricopeptide (TPR) repeat protein
MKMTKKAITLSLGLVVMGSASFAQSIADAKKALDAEQYQKATSMLKSLVNSQATKGENYYNLGEAYLQTEYPDSARAVFTKGVTADPKNPLNYIGLGEADLAANNVASAKTNFAKAVEVSSKKDYVPQLYIGKAYVAAAKPDFAAALPFLQKAEALDEKDKDAETFVALGDFYAAQKKNSEGLQNYMRALNIDGTLLRAKVQIGKMYKESRAFPEAETALKEVVAANPNYGPAYRELSELYNQWSFGAPEADAKAKSALAIQNYKKYLDLTDKSFDSRIRYAQILFYAKDYPALEAETNALAALSPNSPKALLVSRLRGYSAYENKNYPQALQYMTEFFAKAKDTSRIVADDYLYLGQAQLQNKQDSLALPNIMKAVQKDSTKIEALADVAKSFYDNKDWKKAVETYTLVNKLNPNGKGSLYNYFYHGIASYFLYGAGYKAKTNPPKSLLVQADSSFRHVAKISPTTTDAYLWSGRVNQLLEDEKAPQGLMIPFYQKYIDSVSVKEQTPVMKKNLIESYNVIAGFSSYKADKVKAKEYWDKSLAIDPANATAAEGIKSLTAPAPRAASKKK